MSNISHILASFLFCSLLVVNEALIQCHTGDICLGGGQRCYEGTVQVCSDGTWGTVCDDSWDSNDARVVCRQLGYETSGATALNRAYFGYGAGNIVMDDVSCSGSESKLYYCSYNSNHNCHHSEDASVRCSSTRERPSSGVCYRTETYLVGYQTTTSHVSYVGYTRCGLLWRCSKMAYKTVYRSVSLYSNRLRRECCPGYTGNECYPVCTGGCGHGTCIAPGRCACSCGWTGSKCTTACCFPLCVHGTCTSPGHCTCYSGWMGPSCSYRCSPPCVHGFCTDPGVCVCYSGWTGPTCSTERCTGREGALRLVGGTDLSGRIELCVGGLWGTVCDDYWGNSDAAVACYQLGFSRNNAVGAEYRSSGTGPIHMDDVHCRGSELRLLDCPHTTDHNCIHYEDAGIICQQRLCADFSVRLVSVQGLTGTSVSKGQVEVCIDETWGTVCDQNWSEEDARVVCSQLGFIRSGALSYYDALLGQRTGRIHLSNVMCSGTESSLQSCTFNPLGITGQCTHADDVGVSCRTSQCSNGDLWLVDGFSDNEGRLELCYNYQWGTVCDDRWTQSSTNVACRQLGIQDMTNVGRLTNNIFSTATSVVPILLDDVACRGWESTILNCPHMTVGQHNCVHGEDITLRCGVCSEGEVRLTNGGSHNEGRVEVCLSGRWGTVCNDGWSSSDAQVVCRQLGYQISGARALYSYYPPGYSLPIIMDAVSCYGTEQGLSSCAYQNVKNIRSCNHGEDAGVRCTQSRPGSPQRLLISTVTAFSIRIIWSPPLSASPPTATVTQYSVACTSYGVPTRSVTTSSTAATVSGLSAYTSYSCCVRADTTVGLGSQSCISRCTREAAPSVPRSVIVTATSSRSISITWQPPTTHNGIIRQYRVRIIDQSTFTRTLTTTLETLQITGLQPYHTYSLQVAAVTILEGPYSLMQLIQTHQDVPGASPSAPLLSAVTSTSFQLTWQPLPQKYHNGIITHYRLRLRNGRTGTYTYAIIQTLNYTASHLSPHTSYGCAVAAATVSGTGPYSSELSVMTSEDAPSEAPRYSRHTVLNAYSLIITWSPPRSSYQNGVINHYNLQLNDTTGLRSVTQTSYTAKNLHPYFIYTYSIAAFTVDTGPYSLQMSVRMPEAAPSGPPLNLRVTQRQLTSITLAWGSPPLSHQNGLITSYTLHITPQEGPSYTIVTRTLNLIAASLLSNSLYMFAVAASTVVGRGPYTSPSLSVRTPSPATTSPPQDVSATVLDHERIFVTWTAPPVSEQSGAITGYKVKVTEYPTGRRWSENTNLTMLTLINLHPFYTYKMRVRVVPATGNGQYSNTIVAKTLPSEPSSSPNITFTETTSHSVLLRWKSLPSHHQNGNINGYVINYVVNGQEQRLFVSADVLEYTLEAKPHTEYVLSIAAENSVGIGPFSAVVELHTEEDGPTHHPINLRGVALSSTTISLSWNPPPEEHQNGQIDFYIVLCWDGYSGSLFQHQTPSTNKTIYGLRPFYTYNCNVSAFTVELGPFSASTNITTLEDAPFGPPRNLVVTDQSTDSVSLSWSAPIPAHENGIIRHYIIKVFPIDSPSSGFSQKTPSFSTTYTVFGLLPHKHYNVSVAAVTVATGPYSESIPVHTAQEVPSSPPTALLLTPISPLTLSIKWQPPPINFQNGIIRFYIIRVLEEETFLKTINTTDNATYFPLEPLHPHYLYNISVSAVTVGVGPFSIPESIRMPPTAPSSPPTGVRAIPSSPTSIHIRWNSLPAEHQNGEIEYYLVFCIDSNSGGISSRHTTVMTDVTIIGLHPYYTYKCNVSAVTVDIGPFSDYVKATTFEDSPSAPPDQVKVKDVGKRNATIKWNNPRMEHQNGIIRNFIIYVTPREVWLESTKYTTPSPQLQYTINDLHPFCIYTVTVTAVTTVAGPNSTDVDIQTMEDIPLGTPTNMSIQLLSPESLFVSWLPPPVEMQNGIIQSYSVKVQTTAVENATVLTSKWLNITIESLHPYYEYLVGVAAETVGIGPYSYQTISMPESAPSGPPNVMLKDVSSDEISLSWIAPKMDAQNGVVYGYTVGFSSNKGNDSVSFIINATEYSIAAVPHTRYQIRVAARNSAGKGPFSTYLTVDTLQDAPSFRPLSFKAMNTTSTSIHLEWEAPPPEHHNGIIRSYIVLCSERDSNDSMMELSTSIREVTVKELSPFLTYSCKVSAVTVSQGPYSDALDITTLEDAPSGRPYNLTGIITNPRNLSISWNHPDPSQWNGVVQYYIVYITQISSSNMILRALHTNTSSTNFTITDLHPYTFYQIKVTAVTIAPGPNSTAELIKTAEDIPSAPPQDITVNPISSNSISVTWRAPPQDKQNGDLRYYSITVLEVATGDMSWYNTTDSITHSIISSLHPYYVYEIKVAAVTVGLGPFSDHVSVLMPEEAASRPLPDTNDSKIVINLWQPGTDQLHDSIVYHYVATVVDTPISGSTTNVTSQQLVNIGSLKPGRTYACSVAGGTESQGPVSQSFSTTKIEVPGAVQSLTALAVSPRSVNISWQPPTDVDMPIINYYVNVTEFGALNGENYVTASTSILIASLHPNYIYKSLVVFKTNFGLGSSSELFFQLPEDVPSDYPQNITAVPYDPFTLHFQWNPPPVEEQNGKLIGYGINIENLKTHHVSQYYPSGQQKSFVVHNMHSHTVYMYAMTAFTAVGNGPYSPITWIEMPPADEKAPLSAPSNVSVHEIWSTFALVHWSPPPVNSTNNIENYLIFLDSDENCTNITTSGSEAKILLTSLHPNTNYTFRVAAVAALPGRISDPIYFTTNNLETETVQNLKAVALSSQSVSISWKPPQNEDVIDYFITITSVDSNKAVLLQNTSSSSTFISMLHPATIYYCSVAPRTTSGLKREVIIQIELPPDAPSGPPQNVSAVAIDSRTLYLSWLSPREEERNGQIKLYLVNLTDYDSGKIMQFLTEGLVSSLTVLNLHPYYFYNITVTAFTVVGNGPYSPTAYIQMPQDVPNASPIDITVSNLSPGVVLLQWEPPPVAQRNGEIVGYIIRTYDMETLEYTQEFEADGKKSLTITDLKTLHPYDFSIAAKTTVGLGPFSNTTSLVTLDGAPAEVRAQRLSATQIQVSWQLFTFARENISYIIKYYPINDSSYDAQEAHFINTTENSTMIENLHPTFIYNVAVATYTSSGRGNFSGEITVELSANVPFQLILHGAVDCQEWVNTNIDSKMRSAKSELSKELGKDCKCSLPYDYLLLYEPHCFSNGTDWLILRGRIVEAATTVCFTIDCLQNWSSGGSHIQVEGVTLSAVKNCSVTMNEVEHPYC